MSVLSNSDWFNNFQHEQRRRRPPLVPLGHIQVQYRPRNDRSMRNHRIPRAPRGRCRPGRASKRLAMTTFAHTRVVVVVVVRRRSSSMTMFDHVRVRIRRIDPHRRRANAIVVVPSSSCSRSSSTALALRTQRCSTDAMFVRDSIIIIAVNYVILVIWAHIIVVSIHNCSLRRTCSD